MLNFSFEDKSWVTSGCRKLNFGLKENSKVPISSSRIFEDHDELAGTFSGKREMLCKNFIHFLKAISTCIEHSLKYNIIIKNNMKCKH